jgi:excisionase family DNA binding protein
MERALTVRQVADYLNVDIKVIYRLVNGGALPGFKVAGTWRFKRDDIDSWIEAQKQRAVSEHTLSDTTPLAHTRCAPEATD